MTFDVADIKVEVGDGVIRYVRKGRGATSIAAILEREDDVDGRPHRLMLDREICVAGEPVELDGCEWTAAGCFVTVLERVQG